MQSFIIFTAALACAAAAPGLYLTHDTHLVPLSSKSTLTKSGHSINHGGHTAYVHAPVVVHAPLTSKTTVTKSSQHVNHGGTAIIHSVPVVHAPVVHAPVVHATPVFHAEPAHAAKSSQYFHLDNTVYHSNLVPVVHSSPVLVHSSPVLVHSSPLVTVKTGDSAVSHHSSTVHETVPVVKSVPLYAYHH